VAALTTAAPKASVELIRQVLADDLKRYRSERVSRVVLQDADPGEAKRRRDDGIARLKKELSGITAARSKLDRAEQQVGQIPAEEQMGGILRGMQERSKTVASAEARLADLTRQLDETASHANHLRVRLNAAQERMSTEFRDRSLEGKALEASVRARAALVLFKEKLLASKAHWLSSMITTEFKSLLRKRNLISQVIVDPSSYRVSIMDGRGKELPMDRLSAGERQLLAISVLSALIKERRGHFPVVVDTPLARLDQQHRSTLVRRFFAEVSHQVVVLSTDQEVEGSAYEALRPYTNAEYSLEFDDATGRTTILPSSTVAAGTGVA
jgi:DNA sulfur modification protein DndD